jgi:leucyl/phenylalanyl-tRNA---protein transferase
MPVFLISEKPVFPPAHLATKEGLLAVGGDLSPQRLLSAYRSGIFPWYNEGEPILWWSPDPRLVLDPERFRVSRRLARLVRNGRFRITMDTAFDRVIDACARVRTEKGEGTWISPEMMDAYGGLHDLGVAHSVESWVDGSLVGGLYGLALGRAFFGESMFSSVSNASKVAFVRLVEYLARNEFELIDCQVTTRHLLRFGAREIPRRVFLSRLRAALDVPESSGPWTLDDP